MQNQKPVENFLLLAIFICLFFKTKISAKQVVFYNNN